MAEQTVGLGTDKGIQGKPRTTEGGIAVGFQSLSRV